jgi:hypothetical protein
MPVHQNSRPRGISTIRDLLGVSDYWHQSLDFLEAIDDQAGATRRRKTPSALAGGTLSTL